MLYISTIQDDSENWITNMDKISDCFIAFYQDWLSDHDQSNTSYIDILPRNCSTLEQAQLMETIPREVQNFGISFGGCCSNFLSYI